MIYTKYMIDNRENDLYVIDNFLNETEIETYLEYVKNQSESQIKKAFNNQTNFFNAKLENSELSQTFYKKVENINIVDKSDMNRKPIKACNYVFMAKYNPDGNFNLHTDTGSHFLPDEISYQTLLIYLNNDYTGGETTFYNQNFEKKVVVIPKKGTAILFKIDLWHQGEKVLKGRKYWIGTEIVWSTNK